MLDEDLRLLGRRAESVEVADGVVVLQEGREATGLYIVERGTVAIVRGGVEIGSLSMGSVFGEMSLLMEQPVTASVVARASVALGFVQRDKLQRLLETYPSLASRYYRSLATILADRLRRASSELASGPDPETLLLEASRSSEVSNHGEEQ